MLARLPRRWAGAPAIAESRQRLFAHLRRSAGVTGKISYRAWLSYRVSAAELASFSVVYLVCALIADSWFFAGGSLKCVVEAGKHWRLSTRPGNDEDVVADVEVVEDADERDAS